MFSEFLAGWFYVLFPVGVIAITASLPVGFSAALLLGLGRPFGGRCAAVGVGAVGVALLAAVPAYLIVWLAPALIDVTFTENVHYAQECATLAMIAGAELVYAIVLVRD